MLWSRSGKEHGSHGIYQQNAFSLLMEKELKLCLNLVAPFGPKSRMKPPRFPPELAFSRVEDLGRNNTPTDRRVELPRYCLSCSGTSKTEASKAQLERFSWHRAVRKDFEYRSKKA